LALAQAAMLPLTVVIKSTGVPASKDPNIVYDFVKKLLLGAVAH